MYDNLNDNCPADYWKREEIDEEYDINLEEEADEEKREYLKELAQYED